MSPPQNAVGSPVPYTEHAISVSLPTWADTVGFKKGDVSVLARMQTGYPRYFIHLSIRKLAKICEQKFGTSSERSLLLRSYRAAEACCAFMTLRDGGPARIVHLRIPDTRTCAQTYVVLFPSESFPTADEFWKYTGLGISSRLAEYCFSSLTAPTLSSSIDDATRAGMPTTATNLHSVANLSQNTPPDFSPALVSNGTNGLEKSNGQIMQCPAVPVGYFDDVHQCTVNAKTVLRRRIAGLFSGDSQTAKSKNLGQDAPALDVTETDVFLYPTGMAAIWSAHQLCMDALGKRKSVCFGFPYVETLKILENWGPGCYFFPDGRDSSIDELEAVLSMQHSLDPSTPPVLALFTEFPSNPQLRSVNLPRLRMLADKYDFLIVIDDTIGTSVNVRVLPYADIVVTSLTKFFSGSADVMGGSLVVNPARKHYTKLTGRLHNLYEDIYFDEDVLVMERNSREFERRMAIINDNAEAVADFIRSASTVVTEVLYPKWQTPANYDACRTKSGSGDGQYGGLLSVLFTSPAAAQAFFDALPCAKGPSLGTNFTLACPYAIIAHFTELDWAAQYGVPVELVRVSIGLEDRESLLELFAGALLLAEQACMATPRTVENTWEGYDPGEERSK